MWIFFLSTSMGMGGADSQLLSAAQVLRDRGHDVLIVSLTPLGPMGLQARARGIRTESLEMPRGYPDPRGLWRLARMVRDWRPDVMHSHMVHANLMARALRLVAPVPALVSTIHNIYEGGAMRMAAYRLTNRLVDHMTIVSQAAADRFVRDRIVPRSLLTIVPNGVDTEQIRQVPPGTREALRHEIGVDQAFVWLAVGRFEPAKDYPNMLRAFARCADAARCGAPAGRPGIAAPETEGLSRELGLGESVRFLGVRDDVPRVMSAADGYVMSSAWEGMPMVVSRPRPPACPSWPRPWVATTRSSSTGARASSLPGDDARLADGMLRLSGLPDADRRVFGDRGREHVEARYGLGRVADRWRGSTETCWRARA